MKFKSSALLVAFLLFISSSGVADNRENTTWPGFEAFSFDRPQYYYNVNGHDYTQDEIETMVSDFYEAGFSGIMLEFEWEYNADYQGLGRGWYALTNGDSIINQYFKDDKVVEYFISAAKDYGLKISIIISSLNDRIGTNEDGYTDPYNSTYPWWIYPNEKAFDLFKRKVDIIATLDVDALVIDFASTPYKATSYNDTVYEVLELTDSQIDYIKSNYPEIEVYVAANPTYRDGLALDGDRIKMHGGKVLHWENYDSKFTLGVESNDEGYFIYPVHPTFWWHIGFWTSVSQAAELVYDTDASPGVVFLHTPLTHNAYLSYSIQGVIGPGLENHFPVLDSIDDIEVKETELITIVANGMDPDDDSLTYYITDPRFDQDYNVFTWRPEEGERGIYNPTIIVTDPYNCQDSQTVNIKVTSVQPYLFFLISPDGDTLPDEITLQWQESVGPDPEETLLYCLYYATSETFDNDSTTEICGLTNTSYTLTDLDFYTTYYWKVKAYNQAGAETWSDQTCSFFSYISMDSNCDGKCTVTDIVYKFNFLFRNGNPPCIIQAADHTCDGEVTITDLVCHINFFFHHGPPKCIPEF
jgi:hypothetical protein